MCVICVWRGPFLRNLSWLLCSSPETQLPSSASCVFFSLKPEWSGLSLPSHRPQHNLFPLKFTGNDISFAHGLGPWTMRVGDVRVFMMQRGNDSQLPCLNREHIWREGGEEIPKRSKGKEEWMSAFRRFNVISCSFVLKYSISDSGAALENIWRDTVTPIRTCTQTHCPRD